MINNFGGNLQADTKTRAYWVRLHLRCHKMDVFEYCIRIGTHSSTLHKSSDRSIDNNCDFALYFSNLQSKNIAIIVRKIFGRPCRAHNRNDATAFTTFARKSFESVKQWTATPHSDGMRHSRQTPHTTRFFSCRMLSSEKQRFRSKCLSMVSTIELNGIFSAFL